MLVHDSFFNKILLQFKTYTAIIPNKLRNKCGFMQEMCFVADDA